MEGSPSANFHTALYSKHLESHAKIINFSGFMMPLHYGSQLEEHEIVRTDVGVFDVSHMGVIDIQGQAATDFIRKLLANDVIKLANFSALYSPLLNYSGHILDDLIVYKMNSDYYRLVVNAATKIKDLAWIDELLSQEGRKNNINYKNSNNIINKLTITHQVDLGILAIQGPNVFEKLRGILSDELINTILHLKPFDFLIDNGNFIARTGYTGEIGIEVILPNSEIINLWDKLLANHIRPIGLGARDTLRLEAGFNLYGQDMDESVTPDESNMAWTVDRRDETRDFIGKKGLLEKKKSGMDKKLVGIMLEEEGAGILRHGMVVCKEDKNNHINHSGVITSGGYSPTLKKSIALARVPKEYRDRCFVEIRGKLQVARMVNLPFVGKNKNKKI